MANFSDPKDAVDKRRISIGEGKYINQDQKMGYSIGNRFAMPFSVQLVSEQ